MNERAKRIVKGLIDKEWSSKRLAEESGVHENTVSGIMTGKVKRPKPETLKKIADALGMDVTEII